jgi:hypothetical protein
MVTPDPEGARAWEYARCTVQLQDDLEAAGAEALFDHALSNGLAAIVSAEWPGDELRKDGKIKSAVDLLAVVEEKLPQAAPGVFRLPYADPSGNPEILVAAGVLREAVTMTQPIRHARPSQGTRLLAVHVHALVALDEHPALRHLADEHFDDLWRRETRSDRLAQQRAAWYVEQLQEQAPGEWERRIAQTYIDQFLPFDLKERYGSPGTQICPVCDQDSLVVTVLDPYGAGIGAGTCCVCGYTRTEFMADDEGQTVRIEEHLTRDD